MSVTIKNNKRYKREVVIPFEGEEMFVVPKSKGFGQPDMEGYVMASGVRSTGLDTNTSTSTLDTNTNTTLSGASTLFQTGNTGLTAIGSSSDIPPPRGTTSTSTNTDPMGTLDGNVIVGSGTNAGDMPTGNQSQTGTTTIINASPLPETGNNSSVGETPRVIGAIEGVGIQIGNEVQTPNNTGSNIENPNNEIPNTEIPLFPNLSNMNCTDLTLEMTRLSSLIASNVFAIPIANAYNNQLASAKTLHENKCTKVLPKDDIIIKPIDIISGGGGGGGGFGGGGFGGGGFAPEEPLQEDEVIKDESGKKIGLFVIFAIIGGLYFLTRKSS